jgi:hypothetical protein
LGNLSMLASIRLDDLSRLTREEQWPLWLEDLEDILILKDLKRHYDGTAVEPSGPELEEQQLEFIQKYEAIRSIIHSAISPEIHKHMKDHGYDEAKHRGKDIINYVEKSVRREPQAEGAAQKTEKDNQKEGLPKRQD